MNKFRELGIMDPILKVIEREGFEEPTEIQKKTIPVILQGRDIIAGSATGSGKTLAFACAIIAKVERNKGVQAIVLTPTRELAEQVSEAIENFSKFKGLTVTSIVGGVSINPQIHRLRRTDVVVGTPGRVLDHLSRRTLNLGKAKIVVLDEADRMFDMGFIDDVSKILSQCQKPRQTLLYSATVTPELAHLARNHMNNPVKVSVDSYVDPKKLKQVYYQIQVNLKFSLLVHFLKQEHSSLVMVFCNTQRATDFVARNLVKNNIDAIAIHGGMSQAKRTRTLDRFHSGKTFVLVCTDVAARGLHIEGVSHVYNYDLPRESKQYVHRIGRTARAGKEGIAISLLCEQDHDNFRRVMTHYDVDVEKMNTPQIEQIPVMSMQKRYGSSNYRGQNRFNRGPSRFNRGPSRFNKGRSRRRYHN